MERQLTFSPFWPGTPELGVEGALDGFRVVAAALRGGPDRVFHLERESRRERAEPVGADYPVRKGHATSSDGRRPSASCRIAIRDRNLEPGVECLAACASNELSNWAYAASWYSWISPPSRSRRRRRSRSSTSASGWSSLSGARCPSARCGRCSL